MRARRPDSRASMGNRSNRLDLSPDHRIAHGELVYCVEVDGLPVAAFPCASEAEAASMMHQPWFAEDLASLSIASRPLWQPGDHLAVRLATGAEIAMFSDGAAHTLHDDGLVIVYLVTVDDPRSVAR